MLKARRHAFGDQHEASIETALQYALILVQQDRPQTAAKILQPLARPGVPGMTHEMLDCTTVIGQALSQKGKWVEAEPLLTRAWEERKRSMTGSSPATFLAGWHLSLALYHQSKYHKAKDVLQALRSSRADEPVKSVETLQVTGLLAWTCRHVNELQMAEKLARLVWDEVKEKNILGPSFSTGANMIWLLCRVGKSAKDRDEADIVWKKVLQSKKGCSSDEARATVDLWRGLAKDLDKFAKERRSWSVTADEMRKEANKLEKLCK